MDVVYIIGTGSKWDNNELRYSLRSIAKFGGNLGEVYIVGDRLPPFIDPSTVRYLHVRDITTNKPALNVYYKLCRLFDQTDIKRFLLSSDDHFLIRPVDLEKWPLFYKGKEMPRETTKGVGDKRYTKTMADTRAFMERQNLDLRYWEGHINKLYTREAWEELHSWPMKDDFEGSMFNSRFGLSCNSPIAALIYRRHYLDIPTRQRKDIKLKHLDRDEDFASLQGDIAFSIYNSAIHTGVEDYLRYSFPKRSGFEWPGE